MMIFRRPDSEGSPRSIVLIRDVIEIAAILAAGCWAIYVFVYTDKIEPYQKPIAPTVRAEMTVDGVRGDLLALRLMQSIQNSGPVPIYVVGSVASVSGIMYGVAWREPQWATQSGVQSGVQLLKQGVRAKRFDNIYAYVQRSTIRLDPGLTWEHSWIVLVPRRSYDVLVFDPSFKFTRSSDLTAVSVRLAKNGLIYLAGPGDDIGSETQMSTWRWR